MIRNLSNISYDDSNIVRYQLNFRLHDQNVSSLILTQYMINAPL